LVSKKTGSRKKDYWKRKKLIGTSHQEELEKKTTGRGYRYSAINAGNWGLKFREEWGVLKIGKSNWVVGKKKGREKKNTSRHSEYLNKQKFS